MVRMMMRSMFVFVNMMMRTLLLRLGLLWFHSWAGSIVQEWIRTAWSSFILTTAGWNCIQIILSGISFRQIHKTVAGQMTQSSTLLEFVPTIHYSYSSALGRHLTSNSISLTFHMSLYTLLSQYRSYIKMEWQIQILSVLLRHSSNRIADPISMTPNEALYALVFHPSHTHSSSLHRLNFLPLEEANHRYIHLFLQGHQTWMDPPTILDAIAEQILEQKHQNPSRSQPHPCRFRPSLADRFSPIILLSPLYWSLLYHSVLYLE